MMDTSAVTVSHMTQYRKRLAKFLKQKRGELSAREFSQRTGLSKSTINNLENQAQNVTLDTLEQLCTVFRCRIQDLFPK